MSSDVGGVKIPSAPAQERSRGSSDGTGAERARDERFAHVLDQQRESDQRADGAESGASKAVPVDSKSAGTATTPFDLRARLLRQSEQSPLDMVTITNNDLLSGADLLTGLDETQTLLVMEETHTQDESLYATLSVPMGTEMLVPLMNGAAASGLSQTPRLDPGDVLTGRFQGADGGAPIGARGVGSPTPAGSWSAEEAGGGFALATASLEGRQMLDASKALDIDALTERQLLRDMAIGVSNGRDDGLASMGATRGPTAAASVSGFSSVPTTADGSSVALAMDEPIGSDAWQSSLSNRVMWLNGQNGHRAVIQLRPAELGPINVEITVQDDKASVSFAAHHLATREAIEAAMPRLREMLASSGLELTQVEVADSGSGFAADTGAHEGRRHFETAQPPTSGEPRGGTATESETVRVSSVADVLRGSGRFDAFA